MKTRDPATRQRDHYWWMHPAFRGEQTLEPGDSGVMPDGTMLWRRFGEDNAEEDGRALPADGGPYANLARLLFKINHYRPGPVEGWYVVVCVEQGVRWAVGQLRADSSRPVQVYEDLVYACEGEAREKAHELRAAAPASNR